MQKTALEHVAVKALEVTTIFSSFDDYWQPFLGNVGPAPQFVSTLSKAEQQRLAERLREVLPIQSNGTIALQAKAWAAKATTPLK